MEPKTAGEQPETLPSGLMLATVAGQTQMEKPPEFAKAAIKLETLQGTPYDSPENVPEDLPLRVASPVTAMLMTWVKEKVHFLHELKPKM